MDLYEYNTRVKWPMGIVYLVNFILLINTLQQIKSDALECSPTQQSFEIMTGVVFTARENLIEQVQGTLHLTDCLSFCRQRASCTAVNFEIGLCILFNSSATQRPDALTSSQLPIFITYAQKICLEELVCNREWIFERVPNYEFLERSRKIVSNISTIEKCMELCLKEKAFECRSANFHRQREVCKLSDVDRYSVQTDLLKYFVQSEDGTSYIENNCVDMSEHFCDFSTINGKILKIVDDIFPDVKTLDDCRKTCLSVNYRCQSFDMGGSGNNVCRLSHLARSSLANIENPYLEIPEATTYEITSCYNVTIHCRSREMVAFVHTTKIFNGKVYAKSRPNSCLMDVFNSFNFEIRMAYHDLNCDVKQHANGTFYNDIVIQHHDTIVTSEDLGFAVHCQYSLVTREVQLNVLNDLNTFNSYSIDVAAPNITMKVTDPHGHALFTAQLGDPLLLRFQITDLKSPYDIFVRELVAMDGIDNKEILLIDALGCPTDPRVLGAVLKSNDSQNTLQVSFDAFKFPTTDIVQFKALVTPCLPTCEPADCIFHISDGVSQPIPSYGKKRRRRSTQRLLQHGASEQKDEIVVVQMIHVTDNFRFSKKRTKRDDIEDSNSGSTCLTITSLVVASLLFLSIQLVLLLIWFYLWYRRGSKDRRLSIHKDISRSIDMTYSSRSNNVF